jgi:hypothetical protein
MNRLSRVFEEDYNKKLSPVERLWLQEKAAMNKLGREIDRWHIAGVSILDYINLYKTYTYTLEASYTLNYIATKELGRGKIEYEGSLDDLFETDLEKFIEYNITDVELVVAMDEKLQFIDTYFKAKFPEPFQEKTAIELLLLNERETNAYNKEKQEHEQYVEFITDFMVHTCSGSVNGCKDKNGFCKRGFMTTTINATNSFDEKGYPVYHRPHEADLLKVVPHNKEILLDWKGHINVEFCGKTHAVMYLYNYLFKGIIITNQNIIFYYFYIIFQFIL